MAWINKNIFLVFIFLFVSGLGFCRFSKTDNPAKNSDEETILIEEKVNKKYNLTAKFYGINFRYGENNEIVTKIIRQVVFRQNQTGIEIQYSPTGQLPAGDFYFSEIWSPDEEYLILPIGKFEGFGIFEAKNALEDIKSKKFFDKIEVENSEGNSYWHDFEKWEGDSTFSFRAGLDDSMFAFKYNLAKSELYCYRKNCAESSIGENNRGKIKATKKDDIAPTKLH